MGRRQMVSTKAALAPVTFSMDTPGYHFSALLCLRWKVKSFPQNIVVVPFPSEGRSQLPLRGVLRRRGVRCSALSGRGVLRGRAQAPENCPDTRYCLTVHHFTSHGRSTSITKKCASRSECHSVGCHHSRDSEHTECRSCCEGMICNVELPTNHSNAVLAVTRAPGTSGGPAPRLQLPGLPALAWASVLLLL
ncbi:ly6/PLAUR domain-containing protein 6B isoform X2 [Canis aureus]